MFKNFFILITIVSLSSCSYFPNLGKEEEQYGKEDERLSVLKSTSNLKVNYNAASMPIELPKIRYSNKWHKSHGYNLSGTQNIQSPVEFNFRAIESIGKKPPRSSKYMISPVIAEDKIFTIDNVGLIKAFDANDIRNTVWEHKIKIDEEAGDFSNAGILYNQGILHIATGYNKVLTIKASSGEVLWDRNINGIARSAPAANGNVLLVNTAENKLYAIGINDGSILWVHNGTTEEISVLGTAPPVAHNNIAFASYSSGELYALNMENGNVIWFDTLSTTSDIKSGSFTDIDSAPLVIGDRTYVINNQGYLAAYDTYSGFRIWDIEVSGGRNIWYANKYIYVINDENQLIAVNTEIGGIAWIKQLPLYEKPSRKIGRYYWAGPVLAQDRLLIVGYHGEMISASPQTGDIFNTTKILSGVSHPPVVSNNTIYLVNGHGKLSVFKNIEGRKRKSLTERYKPREK